MDNSFPHDYYKRPGCPPELHSYGGTKDYLNSGDFLANAPQKQMPSFSTNGRGPRGRGITVHEGVNSDGEFTLIIAEDENGEVIYETPNLSGGEISITAPEWNHDLVPGENTWFEIKVKKGANVVTTRVPVAAGATGSRIFTYGSVVDFLESHTYEFQFADLKYDAQAGWPSMPTPRPNDMLAFIVVRDGRHRFAMGHIEAFENGRVIVTCQTYLDMFTPYIGENGNWFIGEADTGVRAVAVDGVSPILVGFEPNVINIDPETGTIPELPNSVSIFSYTWDGAAIACDHELYLVDLDGNISDVIAIESSTSRWLLPLHTILDGYDLRDYSGIRCRSTESNPWENDYPRVTFNTCAFTVDPEVITDIPATLWWQTDSSVIPITADYGVADQPTYIPRCSLKDQINSVIPDDFEYASTPSASVRYKTSTGTIGVIGVGSTVNIDNKYITVGQANLASVLGQLRSEGSIPLSLRIRSGAYGTPSNYGCMPEINVPFIIDQDLSDFVTNNVLDEALSELNDATFAGFLSNQQAIYVDENYQLITDQMQSGNIPVNAVARYLDGSGGNVSLTNVAPNCTMFEIDGSGSGFARPIPFTKSGQQVLLSHTNIQSTLDESVAAGCKPISIQVFSWESPAGTLEPWYVPIIVQASAIEVESITTDWLDTNLV